jgi:hypothetical protein
VGIFFSTTPFWAIPIKISYAFNGKYINEEALKRITKSKKRAMKEYEHNPKKNKNGLNFTG